MSFSDMEWLLCFMQLHLLIRASSGFHWNYRCNSSKLVQIMAKHKGVNSYQGVLLLYVLL